jgi:RNase P/RNase MRP subunit p29
MISTGLKRMILRAVLGGGTLWIAFILPSPAQVQSSKTVSHGEAVKEVKIERGEIVYVKGNTVVLKMEDGSLKEFDDVSDSLSFIVDGKPVNIHNAKVGMKLEKQTIATTTPRVVTTVETVTGKVWHVTPPSKVILTMENGQNQEFTIPKGQRFMIDGQETDAWGLKKGMRVTAQRVTEVPETIVAQEVKRTGIAPPPPPPPNEDVPILVVVAQPVPVPPVQIAAAEPTKPAEPMPKRLPKTASHLPLIGLLGVLFCVASLMPMAMRMIVARFVP